MSELQDTADHLVVAGRGRVIADASVRDLIDTASGGRVTVRTAAPEKATMALRDAGAAVAAAGPDALLISGIQAERVVVLLSEHAIPFAEVSAHRASLEDAYLRLTQDAVEFRGSSAGSPGREAAR